MEKSAPALALVDGSMSHKAIFEALGADKEERTETMLRDVGKNVLNHPSNERRIRETSSKNSAVNTQAKKPPRQKPWACCI
jgi:hypothetical protein